MKCQKTFFLLTFIFTFFKITIEQNTLPFESETNIKSILIGDNIVYIINKMDNNTILIYKSSTSQTYDNEIQHNKDILKLSDTQFMIIGSNEDNKNPCYQTFNIEKNSIKNLNSGICMGINFNLLFIMQARYVGNNRLIIYTLESREFKCYLINLNGQSNYQSTIVGTMPELYLSNTNVKCDSFEGLNLFCIYYYQSSSWQLYYSYGNFSQQTLANRNLCSDTCTMGNIIKINDSNNNKFLLCYMKLDSESNSITNTFCQNFYLNNGKVSNDQSYDLWKDTDKSLIPRPIFLYSYENSIFIQFDCRKEGNYYSRIIVFPPNLKFFVHSDIHNERFSFDSVNVFNNDKNIYVLIQKGSETLIKEQPLINSAVNKDIIMLSNNNGYKSELSFDLRDRYYFIFSLDENLFFYENSEKLSDGNFMELSSGSDYYFERKNNIGNFNNYFCFAAVKYEGSYYIFQNISLIKNIIVTICYDSCKECALNKIGTYNNNLCTDCSDRYYAKYSEYMNNQNEFNCYDESDQRISNYYLNFYNNKQYYYLCDESCKTCYNNTHCKSCSDNYYFKAEKNNTIIPGLCHKNITEKYYLDNNVHIVYSNVINNIVYKECYDSCKTCKGEGFYESNNCKECDSYHTKFPINDQQCLQNQTFCLGQRKFWEYKNNNIECIPNCNKYIIIYDENKGQCVDDCQNFINPYLSTTMYFSLLNCGEQKYCVPLDKCIIGQAYNKFIIDFNSHVCNRTEECIIDVFDSTDPFANDTFTDIVTNIPKKEKDMEEKMNEIEKRAKILRTFSEDEDYNKFNNFDKNLVEKYKDLHKLLTETEISISLDNDTGIYLIYTLKYNNFTINIYPLDVEEYAYNNVFAPNNLGFINFTELFYPSFLEYELNTSDYVMVILLESKCENSAINELNYYFFNYDEVNNLFEEIKLPFERLEMNGDKLNVLYPLKNYKNGNSTLNKRSTEYLVDNIKEMHSKNIDIENIDDPFYNDICVLFTTDVDTDMTLKDRAEEYYVSKSLCEDNCNLIRVFDKELKILKSLCNCNIKYNYTSNENVGKRDDDINPKSSPCIKSFVCIKESFNSQNVSKNPVFWVLLLVIIFFIVMLIVYVFYGNKILKRILKLGNDTLETSMDIDTYKNNKSSDIKIIENDDKKIKNENPKKNEQIISKVDKIERSLSKISKIEKQDSIPSNENINIIMNNNINNNINKLEFSKIENEKNNYQNNELISENNKEKIEVEKIEKNSEKYNPPKKKEEKKNDSMVTRTNNNDKDLISNDISFSKNYNVNNNSEISFENISKEKPVYIDNLINNGEMLENNYLDYPLNFEKNLIFELYKDALNLSEDVDKDEINEILHHFNTMEDYYIPEAEEKEEKKLKNKKIKPRKNPKVIKLLEGEDVIGQSEFSFESDNYNENDYNKKMNRIKSPEIGEDSLFGNKLLIKEGKKKILKKKEINKEKNINLIDESKKDEENSEANEKKLKEKRKRKNNFLKSLAKKDSEKKEDSKYGKEEDNQEAPLKTEYDDGGKIVIKSTLKFIGKEGLSSDENSSSVKNKSFNSAFNDKNNLLISNKNVQKDNKNNIKSGKNNKIFQFQEENIKGDKGDKRHKKKKKRKIKNKNNELEVKDSDDLAQDSNKKSDFEVFKDKALGSSYSSFMNTAGDKLIIEDNMFLYYWKYFKKRELFIVCFFDKKDTIPYFIRFATFFFCLLFIFLLNCFFFFESNVHKRYINALEGYKNHMGYYFKHEFVNTIYVSLVTIVFKMIIIKLVLYRVFKIKKKTKKMMKHSYENKVEETDFEDLKQKRYDFLVLYHIKIIIFFVALFVFSLFFTYICVSYAGVFKNSINYFFLGFLFSCIFSFIFCAAICFIIVGINKIARILKNRCLLSTYVVFSTVY